MLGPTNTKRTNRLPDKRNGRELLEEKGTGSFAHSSTAAHLQLGLWSGNQSLLAAAA